MTQPAACLFDLDGLLLDTEPLHGRAWREAAAAFGRQLTPQELLQLRGRRRFDCARQVQVWMEKDGGAVPTIEDLLAVRQPIAEALLVQASPMPGAPQLLRRCRDLAIPMALATSSSRASAALKCSPHPWLRLIEERVCGDDPALSTGKPAPDIFHLAAERLGVDTPDCWAFEDSQAGAAAARAAGCQVYVLLPEGLGPEDYPGPVHILHSLAEVEL